MRQNVENIIFVLFLIGTIVGGGYVMHQINTVPYYNILRGVSK